MKKNYLSQKTEFVLELFFKQKYILLLATLVLFVPKSLNAQTAGPNNPGTGTNVNTTGTVLWTNPGNITNTADLNYATAVFSGSANSNYLQGSNYGFAIPSGAIINGIVVTINRRTSATNAGRVTRDNVVSLVKGGVITGNNKFSATAYTTSFVTVSYGSATDTWGTTWTPADINASNFGAVLSVNANNNLTATVDHIRITIHYTTITFSPTSACTGSSSTVVIDGNNLIGTTAVSFNGTAATFVQTSNTRVTATLPAGATTGPITLTTPSGTATSASTFTVNPLPTVAPITGTTSVCVGATTTLSSATASGTWNSASTGVATINSSGVVSGVSAGTSLITYTYTNGNGCTSSVNTTVTVNALPVVSSPASICLGNTVQLTPNSGGTWTSSDNALATVDNTGLVTGVAVGTPTFTFTDSTTNCSKTTNAVNVVTSPAISTQPIATQTICSGSSVSFSVNATGAGLTYQWYNGATALSDGGSISGATSASLTINPVTTGDVSANYNCVVSGTCSPAVTSANAELIVIEKVTITSQPIATQTLCTGDTATFVVAATGNGISYQWYKGATALTDGGAISGATSATLTINPIVLGDAAANYRCVVSGTSPCTAVTSNNAALVVNQLPAITAHPAVTQTVCSGSSVSFSVTATGTGLTYQWFNGATPMANGGSVTGATTATLTINPISISDASSNYKCVVSGSCSPSVTSNDAEIIVNQSVAITSQPILTQTVCEGSPATFSVMATGTGLSYQWYKGVTALTDVGAISGATSATLTINPIVLGDAAATYRCVVSGTSPCTAVTSNNAALVVNQLPAITAHPAVTQTVCSGSSVSFSVTATGTGLTYQWFNGATPMANGGSVTGATTATLTINPVSTLDASANYKCVVSGSCSPIATSNNATLIVNSLTVGGFVTITHTANSSGVMVALSSPSNTYNDCHFSSGILAINGQTGTVLRWESSTNAGNTWVNLGNAGNTTYSYSSLTTTTIFRAVVQNATCTIAYSANATLFIIPNIKPTPISASPTTICIGQSTTLTSQSGFSSSQNIQYGGLFNTANPAGWKVDGNGVFSASGDNGNPTTFKETNGNASSEFNSTSDDKFAIARGNLNTTLETPVFDLFGLSSAFLTFDHAHKLSAGAWGKVELSFDGGSSYPVTLATYTGNQSPYNQFNTGISLNLNPYLGYTNLRIRFNFHGLVAKASGIDGDAWVIDNVNIPQTPVPTLTSLWTDITSSAVISVTNTTNTTVSPTVTTTYAVTSFLNGCTSYGPEGTTYITVTVNQLPIVTASSPTICSGDVSSIPLSSAVIGTQTSTTFAWTVAQTDATGGSAGSGSAINQTLTATGTVQGTVTYTITPTANGCIGPARTIIARVNPRPKADIQPSQTICYGGTAVFSVALEGIGPWNMTYSNGVSTTTVNGITTNPYIFSVSGMTVNRTFTITALSDTRCTARSQDLTGAAVVTVLNGTPGLWTGLVSTDWFDCKNWAGGLPSSTIDAQIPTVTIAGRMPVIDRTSPFAAAYSFIATARDLIIATSASVTMVNTNNSELQISRDWRNSGNFIPGTGTVTFNGASVNQIHNINLGIKTNETFYNLTTNTSNSAIGISVVDGFELTVANNLSLLSGDIRLVGEAQIVQNGTAANPSAGTGKILKDQQGNRSSYHYNYWSSPVTTNGTNYSLSGVLRDGTDSATNSFNPSAINFGGGAYFADGAITTPIKLSTRWLFKYTSVSTVYAGWQFIGNTGTVNIGEGFTMKGVTGIAPFNTPQNYVFVGKPNNGTIPLSISLNQSYLVGNPYPSALDADEFIKDNIKDGAGRAATNIFNGTLYFWDHFGGQSHILNQYIGGYASYTLMGGVVGISNDPLVNANGSMGTRAPKRYIPVAQGFFIGTGSNAALTGNNPGLSTAVTGGTINFKNSQRAFKIESASNSVFFKSNNQNQTVNDEIDVRQKIRLLYQSPSNVYRQILVGVDENTTSYFDVGYDAPIIDENAEDLYWNTIDAKLTIQAVSHFNQEQILPLGLKTSTAGICTIKVDTLENVSEDTQLYIHDAETGIDYDIKNGDFTISLPIGIYNNRFSLRFSGNALGTNTPIQNSSPIIYFTNSNNILNIDTKYIIKTVKLYNILGQFITEYDVQNQVTGTIQIPLLNISSGTYIIKTITDDNNIYSQKIIKN